MCVTEMLVSKELVQQDVRGAQQAALEEVCKRATRIALDNYNQALVQYMCTLTDGQTDMHTPLTNVNPQGKNLRGGGESCDMMLSCGNCKLKMSNDACTHLVQDGGNHIIWHQATWMVKRL